jgi:hypothetical protein
VRLKLALLLCSSASLALIGATGRFAKFVVDAL